VARESNTLMVWAAGNSGKANVNIRSALPYFRPELEQNWIAVAALNASSVLPSFSNQCGLARYWCVSAPGSAITSLNITSDTDLVNASGTSMAAPHVTGALGLLMERYPTLDNQAIRTILLTTAKHLGSGAVDVPNAMFGWGVPDLNKALNGPGQLLGVFNANVAAGSSDSWSNDISEAALIQRKSDDKAQLAAWQALSPASLQAAVDSAMAKLTAQVDSGYDAALALVQTRAQLNAVYQASKKKTDNTAFQNADKAVAANALAAAILKQSGSGALLSRDQLLAYLQKVDADTVAATLALGNYNGQTAYLAAVQKKTDADYIGSLVKSGDGSLTLSGNNSYSGGTRLEGGTLGVASSTALGSGALAMLDGTRLRAAADNLSLNNAVRISGVGSIDTQAFNFTLGSGIADGSTRGSLVKQGEGSLRVLGPLSYSGNTTITAGTLSVPAFSLAADQTLTVGVASATQYGKLAVTGAASFAPDAGLAVDVYKTATLGAGQTLAGVVTAGSLTAPRLNVTDNSLLFDFKPVVSATAVDLNIVDVTSIGQVAQATLTPDAAATPASSTSVSPTPVPTVQATNTQVSTVPEPTVPATNTQVSSTPAPAVPATNTQASATPAPAVPATNTQVSSTPAPAVPATNTQVSSTPAPAVPATNTQVSSTPTPAAPATNTQASSTPAPAVPATNTQASTTPAPTVQVTGTQASTSPAPAVQASSSQAATPPVPTVQVTAPAAAAPAVAKPAPVAPAAAAVAVQAAAAQAPAAQAPAAAVSATPATPAAVKPAPAAAPTVRPSATLIAAATAAARVAPVLDRQIRQPSTADMVQVVTALGRMPDPESLLRAVSQTLPRDVSASAIRGTMASVNRVIATRTETGNMGAAVAGSGLSSGEAGGDRQVWIMPFESRTNQGDRGGESGFSASTSGLATGAEMEFDSARVGLSYAYANTNASGNTAITGTGSRSRIESNMLALYGSLPLGELSLGWQADLGRNGNRLDRQMQFGGLNRIASSRYQSWNAHVGTNVSVTLALSEAMSLVPALQLDYTRLQSPSYAERGAGDLDLSVQGKRSQALLLGTAARLNYALTASSQLSTYLGASYDVINERDELVATYAGAPGQSFTTPGPARSPWLLKAGVSYRFKLVEAADISLRFDAEGRSGFINQSAAIKASWRF
jgi:subtilase-type serine protease